MLLNLALLGLLFVLVTVFTVLRLIERQRKAMEALSDALRLSVIVTMVFGHGVGQFFENWD
jgi:hypothetical protein